MKAAVGAVVLAMSVSCASTGGGTVKPTPPSAPPPVQPAPPPPPPVTQATQPAIPDTPAGKTLSAWLEVFNSADEGRVKTFVADYTPGPGVVDPGFRTQTGGFDLVSIEKSDRLAVTFVVKEKASTTHAVGWLRVKDTEPAAIESFQLLAIPPGMTVADMDLKVDDAMRTRVIDGIAAQLTDLYVYPDVAKKMVQALREHQKHGDYDAIGEARTFADLLTDHLQAVSHDRHLRVSFSPMVVPEGDHEPSAEDKARMKAQLEKMNCGFEKAERLDGNIGYVKLDFFGDPDVCGPMATAALASLGDVDALIFDLRENHGGQPEMVSFVLSYLFDKRTHVNDLYYRKDNKTTKYWTNPGVPGTKFGKQPVYVLTSHQTFSGGEEFCYDLKTLKRAKLVGETTGGGAHPTSGQRVDDHFTIGVPSGRPINPITKTDWEGKGVEPDVNVPADQALDTAKKLAADQIARHPHRP